MLRTQQNARPTATQSNARPATSNKTFVGKEYFRNPEVNEGHYSKKRLGVTDVDPKVSFFFMTNVYQVMEPYLPIPGKPPRKVVIDRQRKLFSSLEITELLLELVSESFSGKDSNFFLGYRLLKPQAPTGGLASSLGI